MDISAFSPNGQTQTNASPPARCADLTSLLSEQMALLRASLDGIQRLRAAETLLPAWAAMGPEFMEHDGTFSGRLVGWPMVADPTPPRIDGAVRLVRKSPKQAFADCTVMIPAKGDVRFASRRREQRLRAFKAVRIVITRMREQRVERAKAGLPGIHAELETIYQKMEANEDAILAMCEGRREPEFLTAYILIEISRSFDTAEPIEHYEFQVIIIEILRRLATDLDGSLRTIVDDLVSDSARAFKETLWGGAAGAGEEV